MTLPFPSSCTGCPFAKYEGSPGNGFVPDTYIQGSTVLFYGQNPGGNEVDGKLLVQRHRSGSSFYDDTKPVQPQPLIGATGQQFTSRFLPLAGLKRSQVSLGNCIRCRPGTALGLKPDSLPTLTDKMHLETSNTDIVKAMKHCKQAHLHLPSSIKIVVAMGAYALYSLTGTKDVTAWRGYGMDDVIVPEKHTTWDTTVYNDLTGRHVVYAMIHPAALYQGENKRFFHATIQDFIKLKLLLQGQWPAQLPTWSTHPPTTWPRYAAFDTEYVVENNHLIRWSLCDTNYNLHCVEAINTPYNRIPIQPGSTVVIQNALADIAHLACIVDIAKVQIEDMMLAHSVLWTGEPHSLNYIASMYGNFNRYKHLISVEGQEQLYSALDAYEPMAMWRSHFIPQFKADTLSWQIYKRYRLPLIHIIDKAQQTGARVDTTRLTEVQRILQDRIDSIQEEARLISGNEQLNIGGSKDMLQLIYGVEEDPNDQ